MQRSNADLGSRFAQRIGSPVAVYVFVLADVLANVAVVVAPNPPNPYAIAPSGRC